MEHMVAHSALHSTKRQSLIAADTMFTSRLGGAEKPRRLDHLTRCRYTFSQ
jgi:hypothetical protein